MYAVRVPTSRFQQARLFKIITVIWTGAFCGTAVQAQWEEPCGATYSHETARALVAGYDRSFARFEEKMSSRQGGSIGNRSDVLSIPVVVHVFHTGQEIGTGSNISFEQIESAIVALNEDFRKEAGTPGDGSGVDTEISFCLAVRNPNGLPCSGVNRVDASLVAGFVEDGMGMIGTVGGDEAEVKSLSAWPRSHYLNVWVVPEIAGNDGLMGTQGFAYFPFDDVRDGVTVLYNAFGTVGELKPATALNRTLTHEVGHFLGLYHTFHVTDDCAQEYDCDVQGDKVCDTDPTTLGGGCTPGCADADPSNYMDYTQQSCQSAFSAGQRNRMHGTIELERATLLGSSGCVPVMGQDVAITEGAVMESSDCGPWISAEVVVKNTGSSTLQGATVSVAVNGGAEFTLAGQLSLLPGEYQSVMLQGLAVGYGDYTLILTVHLEGDEWTENNSLELEGTNAPGVPLTMTFSPDAFGFESNWEVSNAEANWSWSNPEYPNGAPGEPIVSEGCAPAGCFNFSITDLVGDGISLGDGWFVLSNVSGDTLVSGGGDFGYLFEASFCSENTPLPPCEDEDDDGICDGAMEEASGEDEDGDSSITKTPKNADHFLVWPNPVTESPPTWRVSGINQEISNVLIYSSLGRFIEEIEGISDGNGTFSFTPRKPIPSGFYVLELRTLETTGWSSLIIR